MTTPAIVLRQVGKAYAHYAHPSDRLREIITGKPRHHKRIALHPVSLEVAAGEVVGIVGRNGAGKSTLLKLVAGMLQPSSGEIFIQGRVSALLELGGGFHREMTGRENIYLAGAILGLNRERITALYPSIVEFSGLQNIIEEPVKTYSSGMFMRLAFAVATCIEPDILIIDEALSVGDGAFARKSFDRIMKFKEAGKTIFFCSHALYQVEAICTRVLWLDQGVLKQVGDPAAVIAAYRNFLDAESGISQTQTSPAKPQAARKENQPTPKPEGGAHIEAIEIAADGVRGKRLDLVSGRSELTITVFFKSDPALPTPSLAVAFLRQDGLGIASAGSHNDRVPLHRDSEGNGTATVIFPAFPLLKGEYRVHVYLLCEQAVHLYDSNTAAAALIVTQNGMDQGVVTIPHTWRVATA